MTVPDCRQWRAQSNKKALNKRYSLLKADVQPEMVLQSRGKGFKEMNFVFLHP